MSFNIQIDSKSGFCFGVVKAIQIAEQELSKGEVLYCLGDIVHNEVEVDRLAKMGLITIDHAQFAQLSHVKVLLRAHGEPPSTYELAKNNNITLIDASCPVVLKLQSRIRKAYEDIGDDDTQLLIFGEKGHAEVNGLVGQTNGKAIVIDKEDELSKIQWDKNIRLFSQTTKSLEGFNRLVEQIKASKDENTGFEYADTICRQVSNRIPNITRFASEHDVIIFVSGKKSSNGKVLFQHCKNINPRSYFVTQASEVNDLEIDDASLVGICGATSTPLWLMEEVAEVLRLKVKP